MKACLFAACLTVCGLVLSARAEAPVTLEAEAVLALAEAPWQDRAAFRDALEGALGRVVIETPRLSEPMRAADPWLWSLTGRFGAALDGTALPGGIVACSRYGLATRDLLSATALTEPGAFALFGATRAAPDDAEVWPEAAVARLACMITWDDTRRVAIIPEAPARGALAARFERILRRDDADLPSAAAPLFGDRGYRLDATAGVRNSVLFLESARIELRLSHQLIRFRSFLMNGGM